MEGSSCSRDLENSSFLCYKGGELATKYYQGGIPTTDFRSFSATRNELGMMSSTQNS